VLLRPGWEEDYDGRPAVCPIMSLGRIVAEQKLPDGRFNLFLRGLSRARIVEELPQDRLYRCARIELLADCNSPSDKAARKLRRQIGQSVHGWFPPEGQTREQLEQLLKNPDLPLGILCDLLGFALGLTIEVKQALLEELDIDRRARQLLEHLQTSQPPEPIAAPTAVSRKFPPDFSQN
jgi:Lon protease-like protein